MTFYVHANDLIHNQLYSFSADVATIEKKFKINMEKLLFELSLTHSLSAWCVWSHLSKFKVLFSNSIVLRIFFFQFELHDMKWSESQSIFINFSQFSSSNSFISIKNYHPNMCIRTSFTSDLWFVRNYSTDKWKNILIQIN